MRRNLDEIGDPVADGKRHDGPADAPTSQGRLRVIYQNAWKWNYGPFMQDIHEGMAYDIPVECGFAGPVGIDYGVVIAQVLILSVVRLCN